MTTVITPFRLKVQKFEQVCAFELSWGQGQQLNATLIFSELLPLLYREWQQTYFKFYNALDASPPSIPPGCSDNPLRGRVLTTGSLSGKSIDWRSRLVDAEARLLQEFHRWLRSAELFKLREAIAQQIQQIQPVNPLYSAIATHRIPLFLTCTPLELARFPWEAWEISADFAATGTIRIIRTPANIRCQTTQRHRKGKVRILAILGDDTGLDFQTDREAVTSLKRIADIHFVGWQPGRTAEQVRQQIQQAIADERGWDSLFFAGHSNETQITGGEIAIAPGVAIALQEIAPQLTRAQELGLKFALFNSCKGLNIAEILVDLGFSQVAVMREPIHNQVAQEFLVRFLYHLAHHQSVQDALNATCQFLRMERNLTYPSAYLVPSLFCHPGAEWFRIPPVSWKHHLQRILPKRSEAIALATTVALSLIQPVQEGLLDRRIWVQAVYRYLTGQVPPVGVPPVVLIQIDEESISRDPRLSNPRPMNRGYLADLTRALKELKAPIIGIDYLFRRPDPRPGNDAQLGQTIQTAVANSSTWFVLGTLFSLENTYIAEARGIASRNWTMQGYTASLSNRVMLPYPEDDCRQRCPFGYLLSLLHTVNQERTDTFPRPQLNNRSSLRTQLLDAIDLTLAHNDSDQPQLAFLRPLRLSPLSTWAYKTLSLVWLEPLIDFSIPPDRIYVRVSAWRLFEQLPELPHLSQQIVIIGSGAYPEAGGATPGQQDYHSVPSAVAYWRRQLPSDNGAATFPSSGTENSDRYLSKFTGSEVHAYAIHHLLSRRLVVPIPDLWMVAIAAVVGRITVEFLKWQSPWTRRHQQYWLLSCTVATIVYGWAGLQLYISASILLPWALPTTVFWVYVLPMLKEKRTNG